LRRLLLLLLLLLLVMFILTQTKPSPNCPSQLLPVMVVQAGLCTVSTAGAKEHSKTTTCFVKYELFLTVTTH
jgi:hypothetical protein